MCLYKNRTNSIETSAQRETIQTNYMGKYLNTEHE